jgi:hypothetical protein
MPLANTSSVPAADRLIRVPLDRLQPHPANANVMSPARRAKLAANIQRTGSYPPLVARPHPDQANAWQLLDGQQRLAVLQELEHIDALVFPWPCDDDEALLLLATLNRLEGADSPAQRAALLDELVAFWPPADLARLVPEDADAITTLLAFAPGEVDALVAELSTAADAATATLPTPLTFAVEPDEVALVEAAIATAMGPLTGPNRRGRALGQVCRAFLAADEA